jgi:hypothetical protein
MIRSFVIAAKARDRVWESCSRQLDLVGPALSAIGNQSEFDRVINSARREGRYRKRLHRIKSYRHPFSGRFLVRV